jgi:hypothetical protein
VDCEFDDVLTDLLGEMYLEPFNQYYSLMLFLDKVLNVGYIPINNSLSKTLSTSEKSPLGGMD